MVFSMRNLTLTIQDGTAVTPNTCIVKFGDGNFNYEEQRNVEYQLDRGTLDSTRLGDDVPMSVSFEGRWDYITSAAGAATPTVVEALKQKGVAAAWKSTESDTCQPYCVDLVAEFDPECPDGDDPVETITFPKFRWESLSYDGRNATISVRGRCNATEATVARE